MSSIYAGTATRQPCVWFSFIFLAVALVTLCSCSPGSSNAEKGHQALPGPVWDTADTALPQSQEVKVQVYLDATASMKGYVRAASSTQYMATIQGIESVISSGWQKPTTTFLRFGSWVEPLAGRAHLQALEPDFYQKSGISVETEMDKVLNRPSISEKGNLSIIVTDLFQKDSDVVLLTNLLKENCLKKGIAVGMAGIRSQFHGMIYDAGIHGESYPYDSNDSSPSTFRPFYVLALGSDADIAIFFDRLSSKLPFVDQKNCSLISRHLVRTPLTFDRSSRTKAANLNPVENLTASPSTKIRQLRLLDDTDAHATYSVPCSIAPYVPLTLKKSPVFEVSGETFVNGNKSSAVDGVVIDDSSFITGKLAFTVKVKPGALKGGNACRFRVIARPAVDSYVPPSWWSDWNLNVMDVVSHKADKKAKIDGSRTQNLNLFMTGLWEANLNSAPKLFDSYLYITKKL